jgi:hypothetical protein
MTKLFPSSVATLHRQSEIQNKYYFLLIENKMQTDKSTYFYRLTIYHVTLEKSGRKKESIYRFREFSGDDMLACLEAAFDHIRDLLRAQIYTSAKHQNYKCEMIFPYYFVLSFIHRLPDNQEQVHTLIGGSNRENDDAREFEFEVFARERGHFFDRLMKVPRSINGILESLLL